MADYRIDFAKVDSAFQQLASAPEGNEALANLNSALDAVGQQSGDLNEDEVHYLLTNLVQQRLGGFGPNVKEPVEGARVVQGFVIKTAVK
jgi:hypothetical protein